MTRQPGFAPVLYHECPELRLRIWECELSLPYLPRAGPGLQTFPEAQRSLLLSTSTQNGKWEMDGRPWGLVSSQESHGHQSRTCRAQLGLLSQAVSGFPCVS